MSARLVATALVLALCCAASRIEPHLTIGAPWRPVQAIVNPNSSFTTLGEWVLPNGVPNSTSRVLQYVSLSSEPLDERGLGGYVADQVGSIGRSPLDKNLKYSQIDTCMRAAWVATYDVPVDGVQRTLERVYVAYRSTLYVAQYNRPADQPVDPIAQAAMLAFCASVPGRS
jgi:hypothetical protein